MCIHVYIHVHVGMNVSQVKGQSEEVGYLFVQYRFQRSNMGYRVGNNCHHTMNHLHIPI